MSNTVTYYILHEKTNSVYVGSTRRWAWNRKPNGKADNGRRIYHKSLLRCNTHPNEHLQKLWNDHNESEFQFLVHSHYDENISKQELLDHEEELRKKFFSENKTVLNVQGTSNYGMSEEFKEKIRQARLGKSLSEETKAKLSKINKGKTLSEETRAKLSEIYRGSKNNAAKLNEQQVREIRRKIANGDEILKIAEEFGVSKVTINDIKIGKRWAWLE